MILQTRLRYLSQSVANDLGSPASAFLSRWSSFPTKDTCASSTSIDEAALPFRDSIGISSDISVIHIVAQPRDSCLPTVYLRYDAFGKKLTKAGTYSTHRESVGYSGQWGGYTDFANYSVLTHSQPNSPIFERVLMGYRYYSPRQGIFLTQDPIGYALYAYCDGDPVNRIDPHGLSDKTIWGQLLRWETWSGGLGTGAAVVADTLSFGAFDSRPWKKQPGYEGSAALAYGGREILTTVGAGGAVAKVTGKVKEGIATVKLYRGTRAIRAALEAERAIERAEPIIEGYHLLSQAPGLARRFQAAGLNIEEYLVPLERNLH